MLLQSTTELRAPRPVRRRQMRSAALLGVLVGLTACDNTFDMDMRRFADGGLSTTQAAQSATTAARPKADARGVISYPSYQVALAKRGDTVANIASRIGMAPAELGRYNGVSVDARLREGEVLALPRRVAEPTTGVIQPTDNIDITALAGDAIDRAGTTTATPVATVTSGEQPTRHRVKRGETAYSIARTYGVSVRALADWNGLGSSLTVREGQFLMIPVKVDAPVKPTRVSQPGQGSTAPIPPSSAKPLPKDEAKPAKAPTPTSPKLEETRTPASTARMSLPVAGKVTSLFDADKAGYILVSAGPGASVSAAASGTVRLVSKDVEGEEIVVIDHGDGTQSAYSFISGIKVKKGQKVKRGQQIATASKNQYNAIQFLVFKGTEPVDPMPYLN
ncbi:LysM peptidoglycan-binding domain-containing protein [Aliiroseovarius sp. S1339]|uniref:LysM peptidoglycan-binding domain-containing protein n=1 Tax=Aliiroseovarius sp. S1339 TaxID=2936990 RepID=UPI0020C06C25|nr:LysM peptidoglycan-binding domain-containing protein [Aliiroseovarius sp. S1339]MCK8462613.1 LysM peptidoglycan-binding domain-containing protein [Aliiroseovarius sp. S1339]